MILEWTTYCWHLCFLDRYTHVLSSIRFQHLLPLQTQMAPKLQTNRRRARERWPMRRLWRNLVCLWTFRDAQHSMSIPIFTVLPHDCLLKNDNCVAIDYRNHRQYWRPKEKIHKIRKNWTRVYIFNDSSHFGSFYSFAFEVGQKKLHLYYCLIWTLCLYSASGTVYTAIDVATGQEVCCALFHF